MKCMKSQEIEKFEEMKCSKPHSEEGENPSVKTIESATECSKPRSEEGENPSVKIMEKMRPPTRTHKCSCGKAFIRNSHLKRHIKNAGDKSHETTSVPKPFKCSQCGKGYSQKRNR